MTIPIWVIVFIVMYLLIKYTKVGFYSTNPLFNICTECDRPLDGRYHIVPDGDTFDEIPKKYATNKRALDSDIVCDKCYAEYQQEKRWMQTGIDER